MKSVLRTLLTGSENEVVEFKEAKAQYDKNKLGRYFSALSNEANLKGLDCAWIVFGVKDDKTIVGTSITDRQLNEYKEEVANNTSPSISFIDTYRIEYDEKTVILLKIPSAPKGFPVSWKGHYYGRAGEALGALNIEEIERIRRQSILVDWSMGIVKDATIEDLSAQAIVKAKILFSNKNPNLKDEIEKWDDITFLNKAKITIKGKITNTAILLLGNPEAEHFLYPAVAKISWILRDKDNIEKDYEHFSCPWLLNIERVYAKIRNLKYRYLKKGTLFPEEVDQYDPYIIREALNNCIAHQDYTKGGKINVVEKEDGFLTFQNMGSFIPETIENVIINDAPESIYRNPFLANAMVNLNLIDTIGSGIRKMFVIQKNKFFPLPEYSFKNNAVSVTISGKVLDIAYAEKLAQKPDLSLHEIMLLDKVQKNKLLDESEIKELKTKLLIEGRKPNFHISSSVAVETGQTTEYIKMQGIDDDYIQKVVVDYLKKFGSGKRTDFEEILLDKLSEVLDIEQKKNKIKNNLQILRRQGVIVVGGKVWRMSKK